MSQAKGKKKEKGKKVSYKSFHSRNEVGRALKELITVLPMKSTKRAEGVKFHTLLNKAGHKPWRSAMYTKRNMK